MSAESAERWTEEGWPGAVFIKAGANRNKKGLAGVKCQGHCSCVYLVGDGLGRFWSGRVITPSSGVSAQPSQQALVPRALIEIPRKYINTLVFLTVGDSQPCHSCWLSDKVGVGMEGRPERRTRPRLGCGRYVLCFCRSPREDRWTPLPCSGHFLMGGLS